MDYEKLWHVYRKRIQACNKKVYSPKEVVNIGFGLEEEARKTDIKRVQNKTKKVFEE